MADRLVDYLEARFAEAATVDPLPEFLSVSEAEHLITVLSDARPLPCRLDAKRNSHVAFTWQELRNRASVAPQLPQLGGGLTLTSGLSQSS